MMLPQQAQVIVLNPSAKRESGRKAQFANIRAAKVHNRTINLIGNGRRSKNHTWTAVNA